MLEAPSRRIQIIYCGAPPQTAREASGERRAMANPASNPMLAALRTSVSTLNASLEAKETELQKCRTDLADTKQKLQAMQQQLQDAQRVAPVVGARLLARGSVRSVRRGPREAIRG